MKPRHSPQPPKTLKQAARRYGCAKTGSEAEAEALAQLVMFCLREKFPADARPPTVGLQDTRVHPEEDDPND
jgi:hypothetical protein